MQKPTKAAAQLLEYTREAANMRPEPSDLSRLVLSRKAGESIAVGDITVEVVRHTPRRTVLAITAPRSVAIRRSELLDRLVDAAVAAAGPLREPTAA